MKPYSTWDGGYVTIQEGFQEFLYFLKKTKNIEIDTIRMPSPVFEVLIRGIHLKSAWDLPTYKSLLLNTAWGNISCVSAKTPDNLILFMCKGIIIGVYENPTVYMK